MALALNPNYELYEKRGRSFCSSRQVAETFRKGHRNVLRDIQTLGCSEEFSQLNFERTSGTVAMPNGGVRREPIYLMTKDGFTILAMGYRGKKAMQFKEAYIRRFNDMESFIKNMLAARMDFPEFTDAVKDAHDEPKWYHYANECDMINRIVLGVPAKVIRERYGLGKNASIRPALNETQARLIFELQRADIGLLAAAIAFQERKAILSRLYQRRALKATT